MPLRLRHQPRLRLNSKIVIAQPLTDGVRRPRAEETLIAVSRAVGSHLELAEVLRQTTRELVRALAADIGSICRLDPVDELRLVDAVTFGRADG